MIGRSEVRLALSLAASVAVYWLVEKRVLAWHLSWNTAGVLELNAGAVGLLVAGVIFAEVNRAARSWSKESDDPPHRIGLGEVLAILLTMFASLAFLLVLFWVAARLGTPIPHK